MSKSIAQMRREARGRVREFLWLQSADKRLAETCTQLIHAPVCLYEASARHQLVRRTADQIVVRTTRASKAAVPSLERLQKHAATGGYHWEKAWAEATPSAMNSIFAVAPKGFSIPIGTTPDPASLLPLLPMAMSHARTPRATTVERDRAVVAILRAFQLIYSCKPPSPKGPLSRTPQFIAEIERAYKELLPGGLGVSRSKGTLDRLIKIANQMSPQSGG